MRQNETCCWPITAEKSIVKRTVAPIADRTETMPPGAAPGRTKARNTGLCRCRLQATKVSAGRGVEPTKREVSEVPGNQPASPQRDPHITIPGQFLSRNAHKRVAAISRLQTSVLRGEAQRKPAARETDQTLASVLVSVDLIGDRNRKNTHQGCCIPGREVQFKRIKGWTEISSR